MYKNNIHIRIIKTRYMYNTLRKDNASNNSNDIRIKIKVHSLKQIM